MSGPEGLLVALETIKSIMEGVAGDQNRAVYVLAREALKNWEKMSELPSMR